jgi:hypothetical protein
LLNRALQPWRENADALESMLATAFDGDASSATALMCAAELADPVAFPPGSETTQMRFDHLKRWEFIRLGGGAAALARAEEVCE